MNLQDYDRIAVYRRLDNKWGWQYLSAGNSSIMGTDGGQGYENRDYCLTGAFRVCGVPKVAHGLPAAGYPFGIGEVAKMQIYDLAAEPVDAQEGVWIYPVRVAA